MKLASFQRRAFSLSDSTMWNVPGVNDRITSLKISPISNSTTGCSNEVIAFENRRLLEAAIKKLNSTVNNFFENASVDLLNIFPCYFEKFRTDGVEYDIYVGQSIVPHAPFKKEHLQEMKRWQLKTMIEVVHLVQDLEPDMDFPLQTTQLLFVHPQTIDITFRKDERRFDVEGSYNIRYHIIKKRIDKVLILDTNERLTQPGKIAIIYFDDRDAQIANLAQVQSGEFLHFRRHRLEDVLDHVEAV